MITFGGSWIGVKDFGKREFEAMRMPSERAVLKAALHYEAEMKKRLTGPRSGRVYIIRGITHQASAPGESPALFEGNLRKSITHTPPQWEGVNVFCEVGSDAPQANILEYGGVTGRNHNIRILPRPSWGPVLLEQEDKISTILAEATRG